MLFISEALQLAYSDVEITVSPERRVILARHGMLLLEKFCGAAGKGICAKSFAELLKSRIGALMAVPA
jgi:hypothetical protein